ncbi:hypothetical protein HJC23_001297 [Cyclotella cryptica]|uniref:Uncharacterized protein n=1 Tax=Cyclotella cryptica TaxID=29204 RepID=A0ABD3PAB3_9STRA
MKSFISVFLLVSCVSAEVDNYFWSNSVTSEWGRTRSAKRNLRGPQLRVLSEMSNSMSMSLPGEIDFPGSMSMPKNSDDGFEQFEVEFGSSMSMSLPETSETEFEQFEEVDSISMSLLYLDNGDFEQFDVEFDYLSLSMSMYDMEQDEFEQFEGYSISMSSPYLDEDVFEQFQADFGSSVSLSMPEMAEQEFEHFESNFGSSLSMSLSNEPEALLEDTFFLMPLFDDRTDSVELETLPDPVMRQFSISMSIASEDLSKWTVEEDFEFLDMDEFSASMSFSMT